MEDEKDEEDKGDKSKEEISINLDENGSIKKKKSKSKRVNHTIKEIQEVLKKYNEIGHVRETARFFKLPTSTVSGWIQKKDIYLSDEPKFSKYKLKDVGRKSDSVEFDDLLLEFIKEGKASNIAITSSEVIYKAMDLIPGFKEKSYGSLHNWFKRFRERYSFPIAKVNKANQSMPKYFEENLRNFLFSNIKDMFEHYYDKNLLFANVDEVPIILDPVSETNFVKVGDSNVKVRNFGKSKIRISCFLCIFSNGKKIPPMLVIKGAKEVSWERRLLLIPEILNKKILVFFQQNSWGDSNTFINWLNTIWFNKYPFRNIEQTILFFDKSTSHFNEEIKKIFKDNKCLYRLIPPGLTSYCQPLDLSINNIFRESIKSKYRDFSIHWKNTKKPNPEILIKWICEIWESEEIISENIIKDSFKKGGINLKVDGEEDSLFKWPKVPDMTLIEELPAFKKRKNSPNESSIDVGFDIDVDIDFEGISTDGNEQNIKVENEKYNIKAIRKDVIKELKIKYQKK